MLRRRMFLASSISEGRHSLLIITMSRYMWRPVVLSVFQIVNLIEETGHFHITNTTFDFDLCSLDRSTVRKLQSYLDTSGLSWDSALSSWLLDLCLHFWVFWNKFQLLDAMQMPCCMHLAGWTGLSQIKETAPLPKPEPGRVGMSPVDQETT